MFFSNPINFSKKRKWEFEEIEFLETMDTMYGRMDKYEVTVKFKAGKYDDNGIKYQINHYVDENAYGCYWNGTCYIA